MRAAIGSQCKLMNRGVTCVLFGSLKCMKFIYLFNLWRMPCKFHHLNQGSPSSVLKGRCPAEFISNPNQTHLKQLIKVLLGILETSRQVCWGKLELNSAGNRPSRIKSDDPWTKTIPVFPIYWFICGLPQYQNWRKLSSEMFCQKSIAIVKSGQNKSLNELCCMFREKGPDLLNII